MVTTAISKNPLFISIVLFVLVLSFSSRSAFPSNKPVIVPLSGKAADHVDNLPPVVADGLGIGFVTDTSTPFFSITVPNTIQSSYLPLIQNPCIEGYLPMPLQNGDFEQGHTFWVEIHDGIPSSNLIVHSVGDIYPYSGIWMGYSHGDYNGFYVPGSSLKQTVTIPVCNSLLSFYFQARGSIMGRDSESVTIDGNTVASWDLNDYYVYEWTKVGIDLSYYSSQTVELAFNYSGDARGFSGSFYIDNITFEKLPSP